MMPGVNVSKSRRMIGWAAIFGLAITLCVSALAQTAGQAVKEKTETAGGSAVSRGEYLVESVAVCSQCHTPHDSSGKLDRSKWLQGAALWLVPTRADADVPQQAPRIAGNPPATDAEMITLLTTGIWKDGKPLRAPMPQFRLTTQDAQAVLAYLKSLPSKP